jgi:hypothetical protein
MLRFTSAPILLLALALLAAWPVAANSPWTYHAVVIDGGATDISTAYTLTDITSASIGYHHATVTAPQLWFGFDGDYGDMVRIQVGVPQLERYRLLRPLVAVVGPGMPAPDRRLPFALPAGYGALIYDTAAQSVENYKESYTGTSSWLFSTEDFYLPAGGETYIVAFTPNGDEGKFWITVGERSSFRFADLFTINNTTRQVRAFFEMTSTQGVVFWSQVLAGFLAIVLAIFAVSPR